MGRAAPQLSSFRMRGGEPWSLDALSHFQQLLGNLPAAAYTTDGRGRLVEYNRRAAELWGREPGAGELPPSEFPEQPALHVLIAKPDAERLNRQQRRLEQALHFLAGAGAELAVLTDVDSALQRVARLAVPFFCDWCEVTVLESGGDLRRIAIHHTDPSKALEGAEVVRSFPVSAERGARRVIRTGQAIFVPRIDDAMLVEAAFDEDHLDRLRGLRLVSYICVPMRTRSRTVGALAFATAESGREYSDIDLHVAEPIARIAAIAIENAELIQPAAKGMPAEGSASGSPW